MAASRASWPLGRGFDRWYGFHGGETHQFVPNLYHDNHSVLPPARPEDGYHLSADLADRAIEYVVRPARRRRRSAVLLVPRDRRVPLAASRATGMDRALPRALRRGLGRVARGNVRRARLANGCGPARHHAHTAAVVGAGVGHAEGRRPSRGRRASWSASPRTCRTPTRRSDGCSRTSRRSATSTTRSIVAVSDNGASAEGGERGFDQRRPAGERRPRRAGESCARASTRSAPRPRTTTIRGAGRWPATRRTSGGSARCTKAASPIRASCRGRPGSPVAARCGASSRTRSTSCRRCSSSLGIDLPARDRRMSRSRTSTASSFASALRDADATRPAHDAVLRDARVRGASTTTAGRP